MGVAHPVVRHHPEPFFLDFQRHFSRRQAGPPAKNTKKMLKEDKTCIDCRQGIAHITS